MVIKTIDLRELVISPNFKNLRKKSKYLGSNYSSNTYIKASLRANMCVCDQWNMTSMSKK